MAQTTPYLPIEERAAQPFGTPGLEALRRGLISSICDASSVAKRVRAILLTGQTNDFQAVFADLLVIPSRVYAEGIVRKRPVFAIDAELVPLREAAIRAQSELTALGLSKGYRDLLEIRLLSNSPQHRVSAACTMILLAALLDPSVQPNMGMATEAGEFILTESGLFLEV